MISAPEASLAGELAAPGLALRHPFRIAIHGGNPADMSRFGERLMQELAPELTLGRVRYEPLEDSTSASATGPLALSTESSTRSSHYGPDGPNLFEAAYDLLECDALLLEGLPSEEGPASPAVPALLMLDDSGRLPRMAAGAASADEGVPILATVGPVRPATELGVPHFSDQDLAGVARVVRTGLAALAGETPLYGLVLAGGKSTRMGRAKWALDYHGEPQVHTLHRLLAHYCDRSFVSIRTEQAAEPSLAGLPQVVDGFLGMGPLGGILSAMNAHPEAAWIVMACDLPFVGRRTVEALLAGRRPLRFATTFRSPHDGMPEPLCAVYEPKARLRLFQAAGLGYRCPRKLLMNSRVQLLDSEDPKELTNANSPREFEQALAQLRAGGQE